MLASSGVILINMPCDADAGPMLGVALVSDALKADREDSSIAGACCPLQAPTSGVVKYTYALWS